ncbi:hypothetical protein BOX15_Mlig010979g1, partial [Macrostomum lignano]
NKSNNMVRKILIPMDASEHSYRALRWYADKMNNPADSLIFAYIAEPPAITYGGAGVGSSELFAEGVNHAVARGKLMAAEVRQRCTEMGVKPQPRFLERLTHGAGPALVEIAEEQAVDVIVIGSRGLSALRRAFLGSVVDYVLQHANTTTIVVPPPLPASSKE